jgi:hypothetical protein
VSELLNDLLAKPVGPALPKQRKLQPSDFTRQIEIGRDTITGEFTGVAPGSVNEGTALDYLREEGQNPEDWEVTHFRKLKWGNPDSPYESVKFSFKRKAVLSADRPNIDELIAAILSTPPAPLDPTMLVRDGDGWTLIVAIGDMQFGKADGDGAEGTLRRTIACLDRAAELVAVYRLRYNITHVHIAWLGDHIEGFVSQGGANAWRTQLTLNEQIRLTRRVMLHALLVFAPLCNRLTMAAVPGNHGETIRFAGKGITRYDDSHDTESLIAVKDAADLNPERFGHVEFYVPQTDEMTVVIECSGTIVGHVHGHQFRPNKHFDWWKGQNFGGSPLGQATLLLAGHLHHEHIESDGPRTFIGVPSLESESSWYRHSTGTAAMPGLIVAVTKDGRTPVKELVYG